MRLWRRISVVLTVLAVAWVGAAMVAEPSGAVSPAPMIDPISNLLQPGQTIQVTGLNWPANQLVSVSICGRNAVNGSADCDLANSSSIVTFPDGTLRAQLYVSLPPAPCPCVVVIGGASGQGAAQTPISIAGSSIAPVPDKPAIASADAPTLRIDRTAIEDHSSWLSWFGAPSDRTLVLTVTNTGPVDVRSPFLSVRWGKGADPSLVVDAPEVPVIRSGETLNLAVSVPMDALAIGEYTVAGDIGVVGNRATFSQTTTSWPWGLGLVALLLVQLLVLVILRRNRRRRQRREAELAGAAGSAGVAAATALPSAVAVEDVAAVDAAVPVGTEDVGALDKVAPSAPEAHVGPGVDPVLLPPEIRPAGQAFAVGARGGAVSAIVRRVEPPLAAEPPIPAHRMDGPVIAAPWTPRRATR